MATVTKPIALDESLNTTESPSRNIADVLADELDAIAQAIGGGGGGGGHVIQNDSGTDMTQRAKLQFKDLSVTDDSGNDRTIVSASGKADKTDLTSIIATGSTNNTGSTITTSKPYFYKDGVLCRALADIANGATFTLDTNYEVVTAGGLNDRVMKLLWSNPSPTSSFAAQNINLSSSDYDLLLVIFRPSKDDNRVDNNIITKGSGGMMSYGVGYNSSGAVTRSRALNYTSDTVLSAQVGYSATGTTGGTQNNDVCIPVAVYGIKF